MPLINCEIELDFSYTKQCLISEILITQEVLSNPNSNSPVLGMTEIQTRGATFQIKNAKLYVPVVT